MSTDKDISSTEKLLNVIRKGPGPVKSVSNTASKPAGAKKNLRSPSKALLPFKARDVVGVEIQESRLNLVRMSGSGHKWKALQGLSAGIPPETPLDSNEFKDFLKIQLQTLERVKKARIWALLPSSRGVIWHVKVPLVKKNLANAVYWTAKREHHFEEDKVVFDFKVLGEVADKGTKKYWVMVYTIPSEDVSQLKKVFSSAGFNLEGITLSSFGLQNLFVSKWYDSGGHPYAVLHIDQHKSTIDIHDKNDHLMLSRVIKTGLESMVNALMQEENTGMQEIEVPADLPGKSAETGMKLDREHALKLIAGLENSIDPYQHDDPGQQLPPDKVMNIIAPAIERLARQVERTIDHSVNVLGNPAPARIYLCGRLSPAEQVAAFFQEELGIETLTLDPLNPSMPNVSPVLNSLGRSERILLTPATGVAMSDNSYTPNFLNTSSDRRKKRILNRNASLVAAGVTAVFLFAGGYWLHLDNTMEQARQQINSLNQQKAEYAPLVDQEMIHELTEQLRHEASILQDYSRKFIPVAALNDVTDATPANVNLVSVRLERGSPGSPLDGRLVLDGFIIGEERHLGTYLTSYIDSLRRSPLFMEIMVQDRTLRDLGPQGQLMNFVININLEQV
ncbi:hypothetical protein [Desulfonatronospira sp.]|uniref:hypothetical protein n=1 Tax=Desulfonatronospira sp. TaxID=1962951 RepID=UPI0025C11780|nr:hypothetical protein [Desulfonatronospira sp.]